MALDQSALLELQDAIRAGGSIDVIREGLTLVLQALIDAEATSAIGAERYERTEGRNTHRNGSRARLLSTKAGDVNLSIPKLRAGTFFPALLEPRRRIDRALWAVVMEAWIHGVSTRKVDDLVAALGIDSGTGPGTFMQWALLGLNQWPLPCKGCLGVLTGARWSTKLAILCLEELYFSRQSERA
jgi:putative transposase